MTGPAARSSVRLAELLAAVLSAAGHRAPRRQARPAGLTGREVEVLRLVARGLSNKEIGERLGIARKTAGHHVEHIYTKTGTANRALASLFAANHGLIGALSLAARACANRSPAVVIVVLLPPVAGGPWSVASPPG